MIPEVWDISAEALTPEARELAHWRRLGDLLVGIMSEHEWQLGLHAGTAAETREEREARLATPLHEDFFTCCRTAWADVVRQLAFLLSFRAGAR